MGRTMLIAEQFGFKRCVGVEYSEELNEIAGENIRAYREVKRSGPVIESLCMDAAEFEFPEDPIILYFYNPFSNEIMQRIADKLAASYKKCPRDIYVINSHPRPGNPVTKLPFLKRINPFGANTDLFEIYETRATH